MMVMKHLQRHCLFHHQLHWLQGHQDNLKERRVSIVNVLGRSVDFDGDV